MGVARMMSALFVALNLRNHIVSAGESEQALFAVFDLAIRPAPALSTFRDGNIQTLEEEVWFPATIIEDLGNNTFLVEYNSSGIKGESKLHRVTVDHLHIRPLIPQIKVTSFGLLEKLDAFVDFGWCSGVITKELADSRYAVYFKHTNKVKELGHLE